MSSHAKSSERKSAGGDAERIAHDTAFLAQELGHLLVASDALMAEFYRTFFTLSPISKGRFIDEAAQVKAFKGFVTATIASVKNPIEVQERMQWLQRRHATMGITRDEFTAFGKALTITMKNHRTKHLTPQDITSIECSIELLVSFMQNRDSNTQKKTCVMM